jgi:hypothetical protein
MDWQQTKGNMGLRGRGRKGGISAHLAWQAFQQVIAAYVETKEAQPIGASSIYLDTGEVSHRLTIDGINFCVDTEKATTEALQNDPVLLQTWEHLALELPANQNHANDVIQRCGREYLRRGLVPNVYFRRVKYGRRRGTT